MLPKEPVEYGGASGTSTTSRVPSPKKPTKWALYVVGAAIIVMALFAIYHG